MNENQRTTKKKINKKKICIVLLCIIVMIYACMFIRKTFSRYQSQATSESNVDIAFWVVSDTVQEQNVVFEDLEPGVPKECNFTVSNYSGTIRTNAAIEFNIVITSTTNLPLTYEVYEQTDEGEVLCETKSNVLYKDDDGTYYREVTISEAELGHTEDETKEFALKAIFPMSHNDAKLADLIECVNLKIDARQKISE